MKGVSAAGRSVPGRISGLGRRNHPYFRASPLRCARWLGSGRRAIRLAAPLLLVAALAACVAPLSTVAQRHDQRDTRIPVVVPMPAQDRLIAINPYKSAPSIVAVGEEQETAAIESTGKSSRSSALTPTQQTSPRRPGGTVFDSDQLLGLGRDQVVALLGTPDLLRREPPAELWLYEGQACTAHLFLYQSTPDSDYEVRYFETLAGQQTGAASAGDCFASLVTSGGGGQFGLLR